MSGGRQSNQRRSQSNGSRQSKEGTRMRQPQRQYQQPNADRRAEQSQHFGAGSQLRVEKGKEKVGEEIRKEKYDDPLEAEGGGYCSGGKSPLDLGKIEKQTEMVAGKGGESSEEEEDYITRIYGKGYNAYQELGNIGDLEEGELEKIDKANLDPGEEACSESEAKDKDYDESVEMSEAEEEYKEKGRKKGELKAKMARENKALNLSPRQTRSQKKVEKMAKRGEGNAMRGGGSDVKGSNAHRRGGRPPRRGL
nr:hypothetical protein Iba_chr11fCG13620 [Ipomoea batatas]